MPPQPTNDPASMPVAGLPQPPTLPPVPAVSQEAAPQASASAMPMPSAAPQPSEPANMPQAAAPAIADDGDLIEKEWVSRVKQIVAATTLDPYEQNRQFTELKAEYMQKRYGKSIKLEE